MTAVAASSSRGTVEEACNWVVITSTQVTSVKCHHVAPPDIAPDVWVVECTWVIYTNQYVYHPRTIITKVSPPRVADFIRRMTQRYQLY